MRDSFVGVVYDSIFRNIRPMLKSEAMANPLTGQRDASQGPRSVIGHLLNDERNVPGGMRMPDGSYSGFLGMYVAIFCVSCWFRAYRTCDVRRNVICRRDIPCRLCWRDTLPNVGAHALPHA